MAARLTQAAVAERAGIRQPTYADLESGKSKKSAHLHRIAEILGVTARWLEDGGDLKPIKPVALDDISAWDHTTPLGDDEVEVPFYKEVELSAGPGAAQAVEINGRRLRFSRATMRAAGVDEANAACATLSGNSMEPLILDGSTIGIDRGRTHVFDGELYAIDHDGMLRVKYLYRLPGGGLRLRPENKAEHTEEVMTAEEARKIRVLGWVFWWSTVRKWRGR